MNSDLLDVIVGVVFVWLLFSVGCPWCMRDLASLTHARAKYLWLGVGKLLNSSNSRWPDEAHGSPARAA